MTHHGMMDLRGLTPDCAGHEGFGRFGRLFPNLPPHLVDETILATIGSGDVEDRDGDGADETVVTPGMMLEPVGEEEAEDSDRIPAPFAFFGQFIDHDITLDVTTEFGSEVDPRAVDNFRTPALELDNVFGRGAEATPFLYESDPLKREEPNGELSEGRRLLLADNYTDQPALQRNREGTAIIGDPRNDENLVIAKLQAGMINFYNRILESLERDNEHGFEEFCESIGHEARRLTRWHYQWIVVHEFLPLVCGDDVVRDILEFGPRFYNPTEENPYIPVEFAVGAYRFGHSQIRAKYRLTDEDDPEFLFNLPSGDARSEVEIDWGTVFDQPCRPIDTKLAVSLFDLPFIEQSGEDVIADLAARNLRRGRVYLLPSGEDIAERMGYRPDPNIGVEGLDETPLWYYVLAEAEAEPKDHLGDVGGRLVAETIIGLLQEDEKSYLNQKPTWQPTALFELPDDDHLASTEELIHPTYHRDDLAYADGAGGPHGHPRFPHECASDDDRYVLEQLLTFAFDD